ncbi:MAG: DoxX-like family protein [Bacteroidetes bacterium]|nr:DoxX-like family protein [Bacteroidota bacterium]
MEKRNKIIYWIATALLAVGMLGSGLAQIFHAKQMIDLVVPLGYPIYFLSIIGVWKVLGVVAILVPRFTLVKEWAYAGFFFVMTGALVSHLASGDYAVKAIMGPVMQTVFIILSWYFRPADRKISSVN